MYTVTVVRVVGALLLYAALFVVIRTYEPRIAAGERRTAVVIGLGWAACTFVANYLLFRAGLMSFMPWLTNFLHTFVWIGVCLTFLYLGVRRVQPLWVQFVLFATFSLVVKYAEQMLFGTWELPHFFHVFKGNVCYVLGWSLADGLYAPITIVSLRFLRRFVSGLEVL